MAVGSPRKLKRKGRCLAGLTAVGSALCIALVAPVVGQAATGSAKSKVATNSTRYSCSGSVRTFGVFHPEHISVRAACDVVQKLLAWEEQGHHRVARCPAGNFVGVGTLVVHSFDGYRLSIDGGMLELSRGSASFGAAGFSDAPVGCD
jgi:hypothetical protein